MSTFGVVTALTLGGVQMNKLEEMAARCENHMARRGEKRRAILCQLPGISI